MSKLIAVRLPDDVVALLGEKPVSETVIASLRDWLSPSRNPTPDRVDGLMLDEWQRIPFEPMAESRARYPGRFVPHLSISSCDKCGGLGGMHQRGCKIN